MSGEKEASLRRIAIVLSSLPAAVTARLLGELDPDSRRAVRRTLTTLTDVDPLERQRALQAFSGSLKQREPDSMRQEDEVIIGSTQHAPPGDAARDANLAGTPSEHAQAIHPALEFLGDVQDDALVQLVAGEHPQAVALVLASIAPAQAARILPQFEAKVRAEAMSRISRLGNIPADMMMELAGHLKERLFKQGVAAASRKGQHRLDAILAAMPQTVDARSESGELVDTERHAEIPNRRLDHPARQLDVENRLPGRLDRTQSGLPMHARPPATHSASDPMAEPVSMTNEPSRVQASGADESASRWSTDEIHQHLVSLDPVKLREALASVETRVALLALCGIPKSSADAVLQTLPRAVARQIRQQLTSIGSLVLREIDEAKEQVAMASGLQPRFIPITEARKNASARDGIRAQRMPVAA